MSGKRERQLRRQKTVSVGAKRAQRMFERQVGELRYKLATRRERRRRAFTALGFVVALAVGLLAAVFR